MRVLKTALTFGLVLAFSASTWADTITVNVVPTVAPNFFGSPSFDGWSSNAISALEYNQTSYGTPDLPTYYSVAPSTMPVSQNIATGFNSWNGVANPTGAFSAELGNRVSFDVEILGNGTPFSISNLSFTMASSDPGNMLGYTFGAGSYTYDPYDVGIIYGVGGASDVADYTYITSGPSTQLVNEFISVGTGNAWASYTGDPGATLQDKINLNVASISAAANYEPFTFTGEFTLGSDSGSASVEFLPVPEPISMIFFGTGLVAVGGYVSRRRMLRKV